MDGRLKVKFWGVRGSYPVSGTETVRFGGNTSCVEVTAGQHTIILDAGTGIVGLGRDLAARLSQGEDDARAGVNALILFSHLHHDHTQGLPFFLPIYQPSATLTLLGPGGGDRSFEESLAAVMAPPVFPVSFEELRSTRTLRTLLEGEVVLLGESAGGLEVRKDVGEPAGDDVVVIRSLHSYGHPNGVTIYRLEWQGRSVVYATDTEGYVGTDRRLASFAHGADLLIHDAQYSDDHYNGQMPGFQVTQGFGHSTPSMACELAEAAGVKQLVLFHHDPLYNDDTVASLEAQARQRFPACLAAYEGLEISVEDGENAVASQQNSAIWLSSEGPLLVVLRR